LTLGTTAVRSAAMTGFNMHVATATASKYRRRREGVSVAHQPCTPFCNLDITMKQFLLESCDFASLLHECFTRRRPRYLNAKFHKANAKKPLSAGFLKEFVL
jgi:hypothetical protein